MPSRAVLQRALAQAVRQVGDLAVTVVYSRRLPEDGTYTVATGDYVPDTTPTVTTVTALVRRYRAEELNDQILATDLRVKLQQVDVPLVPRETDVLTYAGASWHVKDVSQDAARLCWLLQVRKEGP